MSASCLQWIDASLSFAEKTKKENMKFLLVGITDGQSKLYHIAYVKENGEKKFAEMRRRKCTKKSFQLVCTKSRACNAALYITFKEWLWFFHLFQTEKIKIKKKRKIKKLRNMWILNLSCFFSNWPFHLIFQSSLNIKYSETQSWYILNAGPWYIILNESKTWFYSLLWMITSWNWEMNTLRLYYGKRYWSY